MVGGIVFLDRLTIQQPRIWRLDDGEIGNFTVSNNTVTPFVQNDWINVLNENSTNYSAFAFSTAATTGFYNPNIPAQNEIVNNNWWSTSGHSEPVMEVSTVVYGLATYIRLKWVNPPAYLRNSATAQFRMPFATTTDHDLNFRNDVTPFNTYQTPPKVVTVPVDQIKVPNRLTASKNTSCDSVRLDWDAVEDHCKDAHYRIYRDNVLLPGRILAKLPDGNFRSSFIDTDPQKGVNHNYRLQIAHFETGASFTVNSNKTFAGAISSSAVGKVKSAPPAPFGLTATDNKCNKTIELAWNVNQSVIDATPHTAFRLERATNNTFTAGFIIPPTLHL